MLGKALGEEHTQNKGTMQVGAEAASCSKNALPPGLYGAESIATEHSKSEKFLLSTEELSWL
jgi:hypothetical protein